MTGCSAVSLILLLALVAVPVGAGIGAILGEAYSIGKSGSGLPIRVVGGGISGAVLGVITAILGLQAIAATSAAIGKWRGYWKRHVLVVMAAAAHEIIAWEGGLGLAVVSGLLIGTPTGIAITLLM